jgi:hypothetical protein
VIILISVGARSQSASNIYAENLDKGNNLAPIRVTPTVEKDGKRYRIICNRAGNRVELLFDQKKVFLSRIPKNYSPAIVGSDLIIGFLPDAVQTCKSVGFLVYVSSKRTNGGSGGGQCGACSEIYLTFLDTKPAIPKVRSQILVGSCAESIELSDQNIPDGILGNIDVAEGRLRLHFLNYKEMKGSPTATISQDFTTLLFGEEGAQKQKRRHDHS